MTAIHPSSHRVTEDAVLSTPVPTPTTGSAHRVLAILRIAFGLTFLWAFLDKTFALGFHTGYDQADKLDRFGDGAWIHGGSPTEGFLAFGADGPFKDFYGAFAGAAWADWLFMLGILGVGLALTFGAGMQIAAGAGALLYVLMWSAVLPPQNHPFLDEHILGALTMIVLAAFHAGNTWGLGSWWSQVPTVKKYPVLR